MILYCAPDGQFFTLERFAHLPRGRQWVGTRDGKVVRESRTKEQLICDLRAYVAWEGRRR